MLFTSFNVHEAHTSYNKDLSPYYRKSTDEYSTNPFETHSNLKKRNLNLESTSTIEKGLNASQSSKNYPRNAETKLTTPVSSLHESEVEKSLASLTSVETKNLFDRPEEKDLEMPKKQIKTEIGGILIASDYSTKASVPRFCNIFDDGDVDQQGDENADFLLQYDDLNTCYNFWGTNDQEEEKENGASPTQEVDLLKDDFSNKYEDMAGPGQLLNISFEMPPETPDQSVQAEIEEICSPAYSLEGNLDNPQSNCLLSDAETTNSQPSTVDSFKENQQNIKDCLEGITESDIQRLEPEIYLNDNLINFYLKLIENGFLTEERKKKVHFFNTYFMSRMIKLFAEVGNDFTQADKIYEKMKKWTKKVNIFEKDFLFIPVNENEHWNLIIVCHPSKIFSKDGEFPYVIYVDSLCRMDQVYSTMLFQYLAREVKTKLPQEIVTLQLKAMKFRTSSFPYFQHMVPKQSNTTDCGLYLLQYIEMFAEDETYLIKNIDDTNKTKWFPRKLIEEKRDSIKQIIQDLRANRLDTIDRYLYKRNQTIEEMKNSKDQFDFFSKKGFEKALTRTYPNTYLSDQDKACLMIDYYYFGTLDFDQVGSTRQN